MKHEFAKRQGCPRLLLFFAGWGMDAAPFRRFRAEADEDCLICYDYRTGGFRREWLDGYREVRIAAWSMGVWVASRVWRRFGLSFPRLVGAVALNGTLFPIDAQRGIPPRVYDLTLRGMKTEANVQDFYRLMCAGGREYLHFSSCRPSRPVEELRQELAALADGVASSRAEAGAGAFDLPWSRVYMGRSDRIFPFRAQQNAWCGMEGVEELPCGHWPFAAECFLNGAGETDWGLVMGGRNG